MLVDYQVFDNSQLNNPPVWTSGWTSDASYVVPSGYLFDGQQYWWNYKAGDVQSLNQSGDPTFYNVVTLTPAWNFTISMRHLGYDKRWSMWRQNVGNGIRLMVNESNLNVFVKAPLGEIDTIAGKFHFGFAYNSMGTTNVGLGTGWRFYAGVGSQGSQVPSQATYDSNTDCYTIHMESGKKDVLCHVSGSLYSDFAGDTIHNNGGINMSDNPAKPDAFSYATQSGDVYTFDSHGNPNHERASFSRDITGTNNTFNYTFDPSDHLTSVVDPSGRTVLSLTWISGQLQTVSDAAGRTWTIHWDNTGAFFAGYSINNGYSVPNLNGGTSSVSQTVQTTFGYHLYNQTTLLSSIQNGDGSADAWGIQYALDTAPTPNVYRVAAINQPTVGTDTSSWSFNGCDFSSGKIPSTSLKETFVTDPRQLTTPSCNAPNTLVPYSTATFFNYAGLAIEKDGPQVADNLAGTTTVPKTTWLWDSNDNLLCEREPNANALQLGCYMNGSTQVLDPGDNLTTLYSYFNFAPYAEKNVTYPKPDHSLGRGGTSGSAKTITYGYDEQASFNGLWSKLYTNITATGVPYYSEHWSQFNFPLGVPPNMKSGQSNYSIVFSGMLQVPSRDTYDFKLSYGSTSDGVLLSVAGQSLFNCFGQTGNGTADCGLTPSNVSKTLYQGPQPITIELSHQVGTQVTFNFQWKKHGSSTWNTFTSTGSNPDVTPDLSVPTSQETNSGGASQPDVKMTWDYSTAACTYTDNSTDFAIARQLPCQTSQTDVIVPGAGTRTTTYHYYPSTGLLENKLLSAPGNGASVTPEYQYTYNDSSDPACASSITYYDSTKDPSTGFITQQTCNALGDVSIKGENVRAVSDSSGTVQQAYIQWTKYYYDPTGNLVAQSIPMTEPAGFTAPTNPSSMLYTYDPAGYPATKQVPFDPSGNTYTTTIYNYDARGRLHSEVFPSGGAGESWGTPTETFNYDAAGNVLTKQDVRGNTWTYTYDAENRLMTSTDPFSNDDKTTYYYDFAWPDANAWGSSVVTVAPDNVSTVTDSDMLGRTSQVSTELLNTSTMTLTLEQGPTVYSYDILGDKTSVATGTVSESFSYDSFGEMTYDQKPIPPPPPGQCQGSVTGCPGTSYQYATYTYRYNGLGELYQEIVPRSTADNIDPVPSGSFPITNYTYDMFGNVSAVDQAGIDCPTGTSTGYCNSLPGPYPGTYHFYFDDLGNRVEAVAPLAGTTTQTRTWLYYTDANSGTCSSAPNNFADLVSCSTIGTGSSQVKNTYTYSTLLSLVIGKPTQVSDPRGITITYVYDNYGNEVSGCQGTTCPPGSTALQTFTFDQLGNMKSAADASGVSTSMSYDSADRLSTVQTSGGPYSASQTTTYTYYTRSNTSVPNPPVGQLYSENFSSGTINFTTYLNYDAANRLYQVSDPFTGTVVNGNPFGTGQAVTTYLYDSVGRMTQRTDPSGLTWIRCYDTASGLVTAQYVVNGTESCASPPASPAQSSVYGYDPGGNVVYDKETVQNSTANGENDYTYDPANRLGTYNPPSGTAGGKQTYTYDGSGNRIGVGFSTGTTSSTATAYDTRGLPSSLITTVSGTPTTTYYCYDAAGNLIDEGIPGPNPPTCPSSGTSGVTGATRSYNYDAWNRMSTSKIGSTSYSYSYDALYRLVSSNAPSVTFSYAGSSSDPIEQQGSSSIYYAYSPYGPLAQGTPGAVSSANYFLKDFHGDVAGLANNAGGSTNVSGWSSFNPWGSVIASGSGAATLGFQGQLTDPSTGFVKTDTRFYDPSMGSFTAQDSLFGQAMDPNSLNQYAYGNDSPVAYGDPTGLEHGCHGTTCGSTGADTGPGSQQQAFCDLHPTARSCQDFIPPPAPPTTTGGDGSGLPAPPPWTQAQIDALLASLIGLVLPIPTPSGIQGTVDVAPAPSPSSSTSPPTPSPSASPRCGGVFGDDCPPFSQPPPYQPGVIDRNHTAIQACAVGGTTTMAPVLLGWELGPWDWIASAGAFVVGCIGGIATS